MATQVQISKKSKVLSEEQFFNKKISFLKNHKNVN